MQMGTVLATGTPLTQGKRRSPVCLQFPRWRSQLGATERRHVGHRSMVRARPAKARAADKDDHHALERMATAARGLRRKDRGDGRGRAGRGRRASRLRQRRGRATMQQRGGNLGAPRSGRTRGRLYRRVPLTRALLRGPHRCLHEDLRGGVAAWKVCSLHSSVLALSVEEQANHRRHLRHSRRRGGA
jgi:hypothetical protein